MRYSYRCLSPLNRGLEQPFFGVTIDQEFEDIKLSREPDRPERDRLMGRLESGDEVFVLEMSLLGKNLKDLNATISKILDKGGTLYCHDEQLEFGLKNFECLPQLSKLLSSVIRFDDELTLKARREGIARGKARGNYKGRQPDPKMDFEQIAKEFYEAPMTKADLAKKWGISRAYLYRIASRYKPDKE